MKKYGLRWCKEYCLSLLHCCGVCCDLRKACENQLDDGEMARLLATLEECLEDLGILPDKQGRSPAAPVAAGVSRGGQGAATVRYHCVKSRMPRDS